MSIMHGLNGVHQKMMPLMHIKTNKRNTPKSNAFNALIITSINGSKGRTTEASYLIKQTSKLRT